MRYGTPEQAVKRRKSLIFRFASRGIVTALGCLLLLGPVPAVGQGLDQLARNPAAFDNRAVTVGGTVGMIEGGGVFVLIDAGATVRVQQPGAGPPVRPGDRVEVHGVFRLAGNVIEALSVILR
jgi:hypothetical protein